MLFAGNQEAMSTGLQVFDALQFGQWCKYRDRDPQVWKFFQRHRGKTVILGRCGDCATSHSLMQGVEGFAVPYTSTKMSVSIQGDERCPEFFEPGINGGAIGPTPIATMLEMDLDAPTGDFQQLLSLLRSQHRRYPYRQRNIAAER